MILHNCRLIKQLSEEKKTGLYDVEIANGKIKEITTVSLAGEEVIDCYGKTLLPGLFDLHTHISGLRGTKSSDAVTPMKILVECSEIAEEYLDYGFTTIRDCGSLERVGNYARDMIIRGIIEGPDIISCGLILTPTETERSDGLMAMYSEGNSADEFRGLARKEIAEHADFIKIMASGSAFHPQGIPKQPIITQDELKAIIEAASLKETYVSAHCHSDSAIRMCIENGVKTIEHATYISKETLDVLEGKKDCYLIPTLSAMYVSHPEAADGNFWIKRLGEMLDECASNIEEAYTKGFKLGFGTDSTVGMDQYEQGLEFKYRKELCHMDNMDILLQATKYSAEIAGLNNSLGEIKRGYRANMILVDGNPDEDISAMYHKPLMVFKDGKLVRNNI
jgi:imidazolonepropionase-like amidohydrolase